MLSSRPKQYLLILLILVLLIPIGFIFVWHRAMYAPMLTRGKTTSIKVLPGSTIHNVTAILLKNRLITHPNILIFDARLSGDANKLRFGEYRILPGMSASQLLSNIVNGEGLVQYRITFVEGWTFKMMKQLLAKENSIRHLTKGKSNKEIMALLGYPKQHPEGRFFPDTYMFTWGNTDLEILQHAYQSMQHFLSEQWEDRAPNLPYKDVYQALIVASLIEKETSLASERPIIAGVILRRLKKGMRLQIDPTVLYGLKKSYAAKITKRDLRSNTAYNTYRIAGLPPTPIDMPSAASIIAALHPADTNYLYYVSRGDGSHEFTVNYQQHLKAVKRYRAQMKEEKSQKSHDNATTQNFNLSKLNLNADSEIFVLMIHFVLGA